MRSFQRHVYRRILPAIYRRESTASAAVDSNSPTSIHRTPPRNNVLRSLLFSADPNKHAEALSIIHEMFDSNFPNLPDSATCSILVSALAQNFKSPVDGNTIALITQLIKHKAFPLDTFRFTQLITRLCRERRINAAWDIVHVMFDARGPIEAPTCDALLSGIAKDRDFSRMNQLFRTMNDNGVQPSLVTYGILVNHLATSCRLEEAHHLLDVMSQPSSSVRPDTVIFNTLINGFCKAGRVYEGLALLERMKGEQCCSPNTITYNCLIDGFCKAGNVDAADELAARMENEGISPSVVTLNILIAGMCNIGRVNSALRFFNQKRREWKDARGNAVTYSTLIGAFLHSNNANKAMQLYDEMVQAGRLPDAILYYTLISGLTQTGRLEDACSVATAMRKEGFKLDAKSYNVLIGGFCKKKQLGKACEMLAQMEQDRIQPDTITFNTLISACCKAGDFSTASQLLSRMVEDGCQRTVVTYGALIHGYCLAGNHEEALKIFHSMPSSGIEPNTVIYNALIESTYKREPTAVLSLFNEMHQKGVPPNVTTYNAIFKGLQKCNMLEEAFQVMDHMKQQGCRPNYVTMDILTEWLSVVGKLDQLQHFIQDKVD